MELKVKKVKENAKLPIRGSEKAAGLDVYMCLDSKMVSIAPGESKMLSTGIACEFPDNIFGILVPRSSTGEKGLIMTNTIGIIDNDYRGEIKVPLKNIGDKRVVIEDGDRLVQLVLLNGIVGGTNFEELNITQVDTLSVTKRNTGGFGSTGTK